MPNNKNSVTEKNSKENYGPYHIHDWLHKFLFSYCGPCILETLGIPYTYKGSLNTELVVDGVKNLRTDIIIETFEEIIVIIEFQSSNPSFKKKHQFLEYVHKYFMEHDKRVELYVVCNNEFENGEFPIEFNKGDFYNVHRISLKNLNADEIFENIENKLNHEKEITRKEVIELILSCYGSSEMTIQEVFVKIAQLLNLMNKFESLNKYEVKMFKQLLEFLSIRLVDESFQKEYKKVLDMNTSLYEDGYNDAMVISEKNKEIEINNMKQEIDNMKVEIVNNMRSKGFSDVEINDLTNISLDDIKSI